jgi:flagellin
MRSDNKALGTVQDALGLGASKVDVAYTGMEVGIDVVDEIKAKLVAAKEPSADKAKLQSEIGELQNQLTSIAESASFNGENWLSVDSSAATYSATKSVVASFSRASDGTVSVSTIDVDITATELFDANDQSGILDSTFTTTGGGAVTVSVSDLDITAANIDDTDLDEMISAVDTAFSSMTDAASTLGSSSKRIDMQSEFVNNLMDAVDRGVGQLIDANMEEESTRLAGSADAAAAGHPVAVDRQLQRSVDPFALPLNATKSRILEAGRLKAARFCILLSIFINSCPCASPTTMCLFVVAKGFRSVPRLTVRAKPLSAP